MKPEKQRIAIAEFCGWRWEEPYRPKAKHNRLISPDFKAVVTVWRDGDLGAERHLPDYLNDLNATHEAEGKLTYNQWRVYTGYLANLGGSDCWKNCAHATAAQRAEALLRTIGKWTED